MNLLRLIVSLVSLVICISVGGAPRFTAIIEDNQLVKELDNYIEESRLSNREGIRNAFNPIVNGLVNFTLENPLVARMVTDSDAINFLNYATAAYCPKNSLVAWNCYSCKGFAQQTVDIVYLNSNEFETGGYTGNWLFNLQFKLTELQVEDGEGIQVHSGFNDATNAIFQQARSALLNATHKYPNYGLVFTGHSLGGAMATLLAFKLAQEGLIRWRNIKIITFGQPRIGNKAFADYLNSKPLSIARVTTKGDLISISPSFQFGYYHSQYNLHMDENGKSIPCSLKFEDPLCYNYVTAINRDSYFSYWGQKINSNCMDQKIADLNILRNIKNNILNLWGNFWSVSQNIVDLLTNNY